MAEKDGVYKTKGDLSRFHLITNSVEKGSWFMSNSVYIIEELGLRCYNRDGQPENCTKKFVLVVLKGLTREIDSVKAISSMEDGVTCEESHVLELDQYAEELQNVFDNFSGVRLDPELLQCKCRGRLSRLNVYRKRPRHSRAFLSFLRSGRT